MVGTGQMMNFSNFIQFRMAIAFDMDKILSRSPEGQYTIKGLGNLA